MMDYLWLSAALALGQAGAGSPDATTGQPATNAPQPVEIAAPLLPPPAAPAAAAPAAPATPPPPRWLLMKELQGTWAGNLLDGNRMSISGWTLGSFTASSVANQNLPENFNYRANEPIMQQTWLRFQRSVVTTGTVEPTYGFQSDWIFGTDYRFTLPQRGIWHDQITDRANGEPNNYGVDPVQFFAEAYYPTIGRGLDVKVGRFYCPCGIESLEATSMPLISHAYTFANGLPFTHTGVLGTLTVTPVWTVQAGLVVGSDLFLDPSDEPTAVLTAQWTQPGGRNIVKGTVVVGPGKFDAERTVNHINIANLDFTHLFNPVLSYNLEVAAGYERHIPDTTDRDGNPVVLGTATWAGVVQYVNYTISPRLAATLRAELFDDPQGVRTLAAPGAVVTDTKGLYEALTLGYTWKIRPGLILQQELRYDHNGESRPFEGNHSLLTAATGLTVRW